MSIKFVRSLPPRGGRDTMNPDRANELLDEMLANNGMSPVKAGAFINCRINNCGFFFVFLLHNCQAAVLIKPAENLGDKINTKNGRPDSDGAKKQRKSRSCLCGN